MIVVGGWPHRNVVNLDGHFGVLPVQMAVGGDFGSPLAGCVDVGDDATEFHWLNLSLPSAGAMGAKDDGTFTHISAPDGAYLSRFELYIWAPGGPVVDRGEVRVVSKFGTLAVPVLLGADVKQEGADVRPIVSIVF